MTTLRNFPCILGEKRTKPQERRFLSRDNNKPPRKYLFKTLFVSVHDGDVLCGKCRRLYYTDYNQKLECTSCISFTSTDNHDIEYQPTSSKLQQEIKKWTREGDVFVVDSTKQIKNFLKQQRDTGSRAGSEEPSTKAD